MNTSTATHTQTLHEWKTVTPTGRRWRYRHRCTCGKKDPERYDIREAEHDKRVHEKEVGK